MQPLHHWKGSRNDISFVDLKNFHSLNYMGSDNDSSPIISSEYLYQIFLCYYLGAHMKMNGYISCALFNIPE